MTFVVDTGSTFTIFSTTHEDLLGRRTGKAELSTSDGDLTLDMRLCSELRVSDHTVINGSSVCCHDTSSITTALGVPIDGILGMDVMRQYSINVNFDHHGLVWCYGPAPPGTQFRGERVPISTHSDGRVGVLCRFANRKPIECLIDSGAQLTAHLEASVFDALLANGEIVLTNEVEVSGPLNVRRMRMGRISEIAIADLTHDQAVVMRRNSEARSSLGLLFLQQYNCTLAFPENCIYLSPRTTARRGGDYSDNDGISVVKSTDKGCLLQVFPNSPAHRAGLRSGDVLIRIGGWDVGQIGIASVMKGLRSSEVKQLDLEVIRDERRLVVVLNRQRDYSETQAKP